MSITAMTLLQLQRFDEAINVGEQAIPTARAFGEPRPLALLLLHLALVYFATGQPVLSLAASEEATELFNKVGDQANGSYALLRVRAFAEAALGHRAVAIYLFQLAHQLADRLGLPPALAQADQDLAACWIGQGRAGEAVTVLRSSTKRLRDMQRPAAHAVGLELLAMAYESLGRHVEAAEVRDEASQSDSNDDAIEQAAQKVLIMLATPVLAQMPSP